MDVRCERCQTEYEVEDASVSDLGTEVQCSDCGHLFTVKRAPAPTAGRVPGQAAAWRIQTVSGQSYDLPDLTQLHKWVIEKRVTRTDQISQDGRAWQPLGSMPDLVPFFDVVESAERARALEASAAQPRLLPLQPPLLLAPRRVDRARPSAPAVNTTAADSLGALPQAADVGETEMIGTEPRGSRRLLKVAVMLVVAGGIGYGGIRWQNRYLRPATIAPSAAPEEHAAQPGAEPPVPAPAAAAGGVPPDTDNDRGHGPVVEPLAGSGEPQSAAAQGYAALNRHEYVQAIVEFKRALVENSVNRTAIFGLAEAYRGVGERAQALRTYRRYLTVAPFGPDAGSARHHLRTLEKRR